MPPSLTILRETSFISAVRVLKSGYLMEKQGRDFELEEIRIT